ncbi:MAG: DUF294 nucleotidyltransferase-like domain-containing protein [Bacillota bacterium]
METKGEILAKRVEILRKIRPFDCLGEEQLQETAAVLHEEEYPAGTYVAIQGDSSRQVLYLAVEGRVEITVKDRIGRETITGYRGAMELMGESFVFSRDAYTASARAVEYTRCYVIPHEHLEKILAEAPVFAAYFLHFLSSRLRINYQKFYDEEEIEIPGRIGFRRRVDEVMTFPVVTCAAAADARQIAATMWRHRVSSLVVMDGDEPRGIITERDLVTKVLLSPDLQESASKTAVEIMSENLVTINAHDFTYQAFLLMVKHRIKHLVVVNDEKKLAGILAIQDLIKSRETGSFAIVNRIEGCKTIEELVKQRSDVDQVAQAMLVERATVQEITALITEFYDRITRKVIEIAEQKMIDSGFGPPPVPYCWITMGSSGRKEQFARTDQDNAIIFEDMAEDREAETKDYFLALGEKVVTGLEHYGFRRCRGLVMGNNPDWCHSLQGWYRTLNTWIRELDPQNVRLMTIFLDFRPVYGDRKLYDQLRNNVARTYRLSPVLLKFLLQDTLLKKVPVNFLRQIQTERSGEHRNMINLKTSACVHIVDCMRVFILHEGLTETNTFERLQKIEKLKLLKRSDAEYISSAYETLMMLRIRDAMAKMRKGVEPDNYINPRELSNREYSLLRESLMVVNRLQSITEKHFHMVL